MADLNMTRLFYCVVSIEREFLSLAITYYLWHRYLNYPSNNFILANSIAEISFSFTIRFSCKQRCACIRNYDTTRTHRFDLHKRSRLRNFAVSHARKLQDLVQISEYSFVTRRAIPRRATFALWNDENVIRLVPRRRFTRRYLRRRTIEYPWQ